MTKREFIDKYFVREDDAIIFKANHAKLYLPSYFFKDNILLASIEGNKINTIGLFDVYVYETDDDVKPTVVNFKIPTAVSLCPSSLNNDPVSQKDINGLIDDDDPDSIKDFLTLEFTYGDRFIDSMKIIKDSDNVRKLMDLLNKGLFPTSIPYDEITQYIIDCSKIHSVNLDVPWVIMETIVATICRNKNNINELFRKTINRNPGISMNKYRPLALKDVPTFEGGFQALTYQNPGRAVSVVVAKKRLGEENKDSPVEDTIN